MTKLEREAMFAKDYLTIQDIMTLLGLTYQTAARLVRLIKQKFDRLHIQGKIHVEDYIEYFKLSRARYNLSTPKIKDGELNEN